MADIGLITVLRFVDDGRGIAMLIAPWACPIPTQPRGTNRCHTTLVGALDA